MQKPASGGKSAERTSGLLSFEMDEMDLTAGESYEIDLYAPDYKDIAGFQMTLEFDPQMLIIEHIGSNHLQLDEQHYNMQSAQEGMIALSYHDIEARDLKPHHAVMTIKLRAITNGRLSQGISIGSGLIAAEAYDADINVRNLILRARKADKTWETTVFALYQNTPNPFEEETTIRFTLPEEMSAKLSIYDVTGKVLSIREIEGKKGLNEVQITAEQINSEGLIYYQLDAEGHSATKKMMKLK